MPEFWIGNRRYPTKKAAKEAVQAPSRSGPPGSRTSCAGTCRADLAPAQREPAAVRVGGAVGGAGMADRPTRTRNQRAD